MDSVAGPSGGRAVVVIGKASERTRAVLRALAGLPEVVWPSSIAGAFEQLRSAGIACVVLADDLLDDNIADILVQFRELRPIMPIFVVTEVDDVADAVQAMRLGATAAVEVPPSAGRLLEYVSQSLR
jgi:DNA-binding NtrC family response regulator